MNDEKFYELIKEIEGKKNQKLSDKEEKIKPCRFCHNDIDEGMHFCPFCGNELNSYRKIPSHTIMEKAVNENNFEGVWEQILAGNLDAQDIMNRYVIEVLHNARKKEEVNKIFQLMEPFKDESLYVQGLWERATIEVNTDRGILDICEIPRMASLFSQAVKNEIKVAEEGDTLSLYTAALFFLNGVSNGIKQDRNKAYRFLFQAAKKGYFPAKTLLTLEVIEGRCEESYLVGDIKNNLLYGAMNGNKKAKEFLQKDLVIDSSIKWDSSSVLDIWGKENVNYIRKFQEYLDNFSDMRGKYVPIIVSKNSDNAELLIEFYDGKEREEIEVKHKEATFEKELKQKLLHELGEEYYLEVPELYIGDAYYAGKYVKVNYAKAREYYIRAYKSGCSVAAYMIGCVYGYGKGVKEDFGKMAEWFRKSADMGYVFAQYILGNCYFNGVGVPKNVEEALKWYNYAAEKGHSLSQSMLGRTLLDQAFKENEKDTYEKIEEGIKWLKLAVEQGEPKAESFAGQLYYQGVLFTEDKVKAKELLEKAAESGLESARDILKEYYCVDYIALKTKKRIKDVCTNFLRKHNSEYFVATNILKKELKVSDFEEIIMAYNNSYPKDKGNGFIITDDKMYFSSNDFKIKIEWFHLKSFAQIIQFKRKWYGCVSLDDKWEISLVNCSKGEKEELIKVFEQIKSIISENINENINAEKVDLIEKRRETDRELRKLVPISVATNQSQEKSVEKKIMVNEMKTDNSLTVTAHTDELNVKEGGNTIMCPSCGKRIRVKKKFCSSCGCNLDELISEATKICLNCGNRVKNNKKFCSKCGAPIN